MSRSRTVPVYVNVYDLSPSNQYVHFLGMGAYHSGIEVYGREWSFGGSDSVSSTGVFDIDPGTAPGCQFNSKIHVGDITFSEREVMSILDNLKPKFLGRDYHIINKNCNSFTASFCHAMKLSCPSYVNRLANLAKWVPCCLPSSLTQSKGPTAEGGHEPVMMTATPTFTAFKGTGYSLQEEKKSSSFTSLFSKSKASDADKEKRDIENIRRARLDKLLGKSKTEDEVRLLEGSNHFDSSEGT